VLILTIQSNLHAILLVLFVFFLLFDVLVIIVFFLLREDEMHGQGNSKLLSSLRSVSLWARVGEGKTQLCLSKCKSSTVAQQTSFVK
jgi:hypothetical protein